MSVVGFLLLSACGGTARRAASPQKGPPATITSAKVSVHPERLLVAEKGEVSVVARDGCIASVSTAHLKAGATDELRVRCPREDRLTHWFGAIDALVSSIPLEKVEDEEEDDTRVDFPVVELVTRSGDLMRVKQLEDAGKIAGEVRSLSAELGAREVPGPGPATGAGWQMVRVSGPAHVVFAGSPTKGVLDARVSTTGQYFCEFLANTDEGPLRATKSGWIEADAASHAIDEVLDAFQALGDGEKVHMTFASGFTNDGERKASAASTAAVFERFSPLQDALGDACMPELEPPVLQSTL